VLRIAVRKATSLASSPGRGSSAAAVHKAAGGIVSALRRQRKIPDCERILSLARSGLIAMGRNFPSYSLMGGI